MVELVLNALAAPPLLHDDEARRDEYRQVIGEAVLCRRREFLEWALGMGEALPCLDWLEGELSRIPWPDLYEHATALVQAHSDWPVVGHQLGILMTTCTVGRSAEMMRHLIHQATTTAGHGGGITRIVDHPESGPQGLYWTLFSAIRGRGCDGGG
ncbi:hypothetical protein PG984_012006 [Apiospora sp. TS-2023a]